MKYETSKYVYDFQKFQTTRFVGDTIYNGTITISEADQKENRFLNNIVDFNNKTRPTSKADESANAVIEGRKLTLNAFKSATFPLKLTQEKKLKILSPRQMLQRFPIPIAQVKADNTFENLFNEI